MLSSRTIKRAKSLVKDIDKEPHPIKSHVRVVIKEGLSIRKHMKLYLNCSIIGLVFSLITGIIDILIGSELFIIQTIVAMYFGYMTQQYTSFLKSINQDLKDLLSTYNDFNNLNK